MGSKHLWMEKTLSAALTLNTTDGEMSIQLDMGSSSAIQHYLSSSSWSVFTVLGKESF